jgi:predicted nucleic acid-binding protein
MSGKAFLDTNIFVYSIDSSPGLKVKSDAARKLITGHIRNESGVISIQVLQEFYQVATQKLRAPISTEDALEFMRYMANLETVMPDFDMVISAVRLHQEHSLSFWDALILQAARIAGCNLVLSEDLQDGFHLDGLVVRNPFRSGRGSRPALGKQVD